MVEIRDRIERRPIVSDIVPKAAVHPDRLRRASCAARPASKDASAYSCICAHRAP